MIVTLDEARAAMNIPATDQIDDSQVIAVIAGVTAVIESLCGPVDSTSLDEFYDGGSSEIFLTSYPVIAVTTVTEYSPTPQLLAAEPLGTSTYTSFGYRLLRSGVLLRTSGGIPSCFHVGTQNVEVAYTAGRAVIPDDIHLAAVDLIRTHYSPQRAMDDSSDFNGVDILSYYVPNRVLEQLAPHRHVMA